MNATEILQELKKQNKRLFVMWIITFAVLVITLGYTIYLLNDVGTISDEYTQEITDIDTIENSTITNGGGK